MAINLLTDKSIKSALAKQAGYSLHDGGGLYIVLKTALWRFEYRFNGRRRLMAMGKYPIVPLERARALRKQALDLLDSDQDPILVNKNSRKNKAWHPDFSLDALAKRWFEHWKKDKAELTATQTWRRFELHVSPSLGKRDVRQLNDSDFIDLFEKFTHKKALPQKLYMICKQILGYGCSPLARTIKSNPMATFKSKEVMTIYLHTHHARLRSSELPELISKIEGYRFDEVRCAIKLLMLTFVRTMELLDAEWKEIDFELRQWVIPPERTKLKRRHIVPLSDRAITELQTIKSLAEGQERWKILWRESGKIFPWFGAGRRNVILNALKAMGYKSKMTGHGFRAIASTLLHELDFSHEHIEMQLAHAERNRSSASYNDAQYLEGRRKMMQAWADYLYSQRYE